MSTLKVNHPRIIGFILIILHLGLAPYVDTSMKTSLACVGSEACGSMSLSCDSGQIIRLINQQYNFNKRYFRHCNSDFNSRCNRFSPERCCIELNERCQSNFTKLDALSLYQSCSGMKLCEIKATKNSYYCTDSNDLILSDSTAIQYSCVNDTDVVQFCKKGSRTAEIVDIIFNGTDATMEYSGQACSCTIAPVVGEHWTLSFQDIRPFRSDNPDVCSSVTASGINGSCDESKPGWDNFVYQKQLTSQQSVFTLENLYKLDDQDKPTMIWIRAEGPAHSLVTVQCYGRRDITKTKRITARTTTGGTTKPVPVPGDKHGAQQIAGSDIPVVAIVVPVSLVIVGIVAALVAILYWRRRQKPPIKSQHGLGSGRTVEGDSRIEGQGGNESSYTSLDFSTSNCAVYSGLDHKEQESPKPPESGPTVKSSSYVKEDEDNYYNVGGGDYVNVA